MRISNKKLRTIFTLIIKYIFPAASVTLLTAVMHNLLGNEILGDGPFLLYSLLIVVHSMFGGLSSGMLTILISTAAGTYYFLLPSENFKLIEVHDVVQISIFLFQSLIIAFFVDRAIKSRVVLNITHNRLVKSERRLKNIIDSLFMLIATVDASGTIKEANKAILEASPYEISGLIGKNIIETFPWVYSEEVRSRLKSSLDLAISGEVVRYDEVLRVGKGRFIDAAITLVPMLDSKGNIDQIIVSATDITERKTYERELEKIHENYSKLVNSNIIGMVIADTNGNILEANDAFLNVVGYTREELDLGVLKWDKFTAPESKKIEAGRVATLISQGYVGPSEKEYIHKKGHRVPIIASSVMIDTEKKIFLGLVIDITERKNLERKKDEFISIASHELKTPLTTLSGYAQLINTRLKKDYETNLNFLGKMDLQFTKLTSLINELLDVSKIQSGKLGLTKQKFDLVKLANDTIEEIEPIAENHKIKLFKPDYELEVNADRDKISQVLTNFLTNAIKYSPKGTEIHIRVNNNNKFARVEVEDRGMGISPHMQAKIFDKFFQIENPNSELSQGMGLGLYIASQIIERHNGEIGVRSQEGKGSCFYFTLPKDS